MFLVLLLYVILWMLVVFFLFWEYFFVCIFWFLSGLSGIFAHEWEFVIDNEMLQMDRASRGRKESFLLFSFGF